MLLLLVLFTFLTSPVVHLYLQVVAMRCRLDFFRLDNDVVSQGKQLYLVDVANLRISRVSSLNTGLLNIIKDL